MPEVWTPPTFDDIATSEVVTASYLNSLGNSLRFISRVGYATATSDVSITATTVGTANQIISLGAITYENVPHLFEFYCPRVTASTGGLNVILRDSTTVLGTWANAPASTPISGFYMAREFTPSAASHTYNVAAWLAAAGTWNFEAGSGGTAGDSTTFLEIWMRATRVPT